MAERVIKGADGARRRRASGNSLSSEETRRIELEIARIRSLGLDDLRLLWQQKFERRVPSGLRKDLMIRMLCFGIQEDAFGGFDRATLKRLESCTSGRPEGFRQPEYLKPGTELIREYQGERLKVIVTEDGFVFKGRNYSSLTSIARSATGTNWNGPKFFGLRAKEEEATNPPVRSNAQARRSVGAST